MEKTNKRTQDKRKVNKEWKKDEIQTLIEEYEARPDLWDPARPDYCNRFELAFIEAFLAFKYHMEHLSRVLFTFQKPQTTTHGRNSNQTECDCRWNHSQIPFTESSIQ